MASGLGLMIKQQAQPPGDPAAAVSTGGSWGIGLMAAQPAVGISTLHA